MLLGNAFTARLLFTNAAGLPTDPDVVTVTLVAPDGTTEELATTATATGRFEVTGLPSSEGFWLLHVEGSGNDVDTVAETTLRVTEPAWVPGS